MDMVLNAINAKNNRLDFVMQSMHVIASNLTKLLSAMTQFSSRGHMEPIKPGQKPQA